MELLTAEGSDDGFTVTFDHFSAVTTADPLASPEDAKALAEEIINKAEQCLNEKLKVKVPDIEFEDMTDADMEQFKVTERELLCPEAGFLTGLAGLYRRCSTGPEWTLRRTRAALAAFMKLCAAVFTPR